MQFDIELLTDWHRMRAYVTPQVVARNMVGHWIEDLFSGDYCHTTSTHTRTCLDTPIPTIPLHTIPLCIFRVLF